MYKRNKSMDFCRSGKTMMDYAKSGDQGGYEKPSKGKTVMADTPEVDFNNPNIEKTYKENPEFREYLKKKKGIVYDPKTRVSRQTTDISTNKGQDNPKYRGNEDEID